MTRPVALVLQAMINDSTREVSGLELARRAALKPGAVVPILARLERRGWITCRQEDQSRRHSGPILRRYYQLSSDGAEFAKRALNKIPAADVGPVAAQSRYRRYVVKSSARARMRARARARARIRGRAQLLVLRLDLDYARGLDEFLADVRARARRAKRALLVDRDLERDLLFHLAQARVPAAALLRALDDALVRDHDLEPDLDGALRCARAVVDTLAPAAALADILDRAVIQATGYYLDYDSVLPNPYAYELVTTLNVAMGGDAIAAHDRPEVFPVGMAEWVVERMVRRLPADDRDRYRSEFQAELRVLAGEHAPRWVQLDYALSTAAQMRSLGRELRALTPGSGSIR